MPNFRELKPHDSAWEAIDVAASTRVVGSGIVMRRHVGGTAFATLCTNMKPYLAHLRGRLEGAGATLVVASVASIDDAAARFPHAGVIINCTGGGCASLVGDDTMIPVRGQTVRVRAPEQKTFFSLVTGDKSKPFHVIPQGDGTCIVGGSKHPDDGRREPDPELAARLLRQAAAWCPALRGCEDHVVNQTVAWRPFRRDGVRLEEEKRPGFRLIHNYGHGDVGVILAWGCADDVVGLVQKT